MLEIDALEPLGYFNEAYVVAVGDERGKVSFGSAYFAHHGTLDS